MVWKKRLISCVLATSMICSVPVFAQEGFEITNKIDSIDQRQIIEQETGANTPDALQNYASKLDSNKGQIAASSEDEKEYGRSMNASVDGDTGTKWASVTGVSEAKPQWIAYDLGQVREFNNVVINWENAGKAYTIETANNTEGVALEEITDWTPIYTETTGSNEDENKIHDIKLESPVNARYVRIHATESANSNWTSVAIWELVIRNKPENYDIDKAASEINQVVPRFPTKDFELPLSTASGADVTWKSNNAAITIAEPADGDTKVKATVTAPSSENSNGTIVATVAYLGKTKDVTFQTTVHPTNAQLTEYKIYPIPQKLTRDGGEVQITKEVNVVVDSSINQNTKDRAAEVLQENGYTATFSDTKSTTISNLILKVYAEGDKDTYGIPVDALSKEEGDGATGEFNTYDAHVVKISEDAQSNGEILIDGKHDDAVYYGLATLDQILEQSDNGITTVTIEDYAHSKYRGIIEGFYGFAYKENDIESLLDFGKRYKMNTFIYGPKADPYHLGKWKDAYPDTITEEQKKIGMLTKDDIRNIVKTAEKDNVDFVWSVHPMMEGGIDITTTAGVEQGVKDVLNKYELMRELGVKHFAMFVDDISTGLAIENSENQAKLIGDVVAGYKKAHPEDFKPIFYVPTLYSLKIDGVTDEQQARNHGAVAALENFDDIIYTFTGTGVFSDIENGEMVQMSKYLNNKQKPMFWWNSPVNDNMDPSMFIGPTDMRYSMNSDVTDARGMMTNPLSQAEASKIHIFGMLDYSWNIDEFDSMQNWEESINAIFSDNQELANQFKIFANHATPNGYIGFKTGKNYSGVEEIISELKKADGQTPENWNAFKNNMQELKDACQYLKANLKDNSNPKYAQMYKDVEPWINKIEDTAYICIRAIDLILGNDTSAQTYYDVIYDYNKLSTDPAYNVVSLEGAGTGVYEVDNNVVVGGSVLNNYLTPLLSLAKEKVKNQFPQQSPEVVPTVIGDIADLQLSDEDASGFTISGLNGKSLQPGQYVGLVMPNLAPLENATELQSSIPSGLVLQYSTNGKTWYNYSDSVKDEHMSSFRLFNITNNPVSFTSDSITINVHTTKSSPVSSVDSSKSLYQGSLSNLYDGDISTFAWFNGNQTAGQNFQINYESPFFMKNLQFIFTNGSDRLGSKATVETSLNGTDWIPIATLNSDGIQPEYDDEGYQIFNIPDVNVRTQHIRLTVNEPFGHYMKCHEVTPNGGGGGVPLASASVGSGATNVLDGNPQSVFVPHLNTANDLTYIIPTPEKVTTVDVYMKASKGLPTAEVKVGRNWNTVSMVQDTNMPYHYSIDLSSLVNVSELKLSWGAENVPDTFYDIYYRTVKDSTVWPSKAELIATYTTAKAANKEDYDSDSWLFLQTVMQHALDIINFQSTQQEISDINQRLNSAINKEIDPGFVGKGDIDNNGVIEAKDAVMILNHVLDSIGNPFDERQKESAKIVDGKTITANDAAMVLKAVIESDFNILIANKTA